MPLTRREFETAACRLWPRPNACRNSIENRCNWLFGLSQGTELGTSVAEDADLLVRVLEHRVSMPEHHRLLAAFPRPAGRD